MIYDSLSTLIKSVKLIELNKTSNAVEVMHSDQIGVTILAVVPHCQVISFITLVMKTGTSGDRMTGVINSYRGEECARLDTFGQ